MTFEYLVPDKLEEILLLYSLDVNCKIVKSGREKKFDPRQEVPE